MNSQMIYSKIKYTPKRPDYYVSRKCRKKLTSLNLICCCAGWGKTAYLYQLCQESEEAVYYVSLCAADNSADRLSAVLDGVLQEKTSLNSERVNEIVFNLIEKLSEKNNSVLLIDNADVITEPQAVFLLQLLTEAAIEGHFKLVFAARKIPGYLISYLMDTRAQLLGIKEMRLNHGELRELSAYYKTTVSDKYLNTLEKLSGGWPIAASELLRIENSDPEHSIPKTYLLPYVKHHILSDINQELLCYLMRTAFLTTENEEFACEVLELNNSSYCMNELRYLGIVEEEDYPVYPEALRLILSSMLSQETQKHLMENASDYYIRHDRYAEAIRLFDESGNIQGAERLLKVNGEKLLANLELELIGYCGRIITRTGRITDAEALGAMAQYYYYSGDYGKMEQAYNMADSMFGKENKYSVYRRLYNGLLRYPVKPELYRTNVNSALAYLKEHSLPLPFLYQKERDVLQLITENHPQNTSELLTVKCFGGVHIYAGSQQTEIQCKTKRSSELIAYLLENNGKAVGREELLNAFWPDDMPANAIAMLHNMIYHLRRELTPYGLENIISYRNKSYYLDMKMLNYADNDIIMICNALDKGDRNFVLQKGETVTEYWGKYLGTTDIPWANEKREYYDRCYITICELLAEQYKADGQLEQELKVLKNAFRLEPYSEQLLHSLLLCFSALGKPDKAIQYYEEYSARLDADFGTRPSKWLRNQFLSCFSEKDN